MKAMILAAGLGTRLRPITLNRPKTLVPVGNKPIIDRIIEYLKKQGVNEIIVNAHHHHEQIVKHLDKGRPFGIDIEVSVEPEILGTGGGLRNTIDFWGDEPFIVVNGDILTDINLLRAYEVHRKSKSLATLILHNYKSFSQVKIDEYLNIINISAESHSGRLAFTGIHIIEPEFLTSIPKGIFSNIIDCYRKSIVSGKLIRAHISDGYYWRDIGTVGSYVLANKEAVKGNSFLLGPGCQIHSSAKLVDWAVIGEKAIIEEDVKICRSIIWENARVKKRKKVIDSIITTLK